MAKHKRVSLNTRLPLAIPRDFLPTLEELESLAEAGNISTAQAIREAIAEYVAKYRGGLPQRTLEGEKVIPKNPVTEASVRTNRKIEEIVRLNPGHARTWYRNLIKRTLGLTWPTAEEHLRTLEALHILQARGDKLYHRDNVLGGLPVIPYFWEHVKRMDLANDGLSQLLDQAYEEMGIYERYLS